MILKRPLRFYAVEKITFLYIFLTALIIMYLMPQMNNAYLLLGNRLMFVSVIYGLAVLNSYKNIWPIRLLRYIFLGVLLSYWYTETFDINRVVVNYDYLLARWEQNIFGFQPALQFSKIYTQHWLSELLNMGYFSYYPLIVGTSLFFFFTNRKYFEYFFFTIMFSFFCYYLIYILFPTAGPQYYYPAIGFDNVATGVFPKIGHYFNGNQILLSDASQSGYFYQMVENTQQVGEKPTAAFPSSHVGISTLIMILVFNKRQKKLFSFLFPFYIALVFSTVYIQAHYVIDVFAGFASAFLLYYLSDAVYQQITRKYYGVLELTAPFHTKKLKP